MHVDSALVCFCLCLWSLSSCYDFEVWGPGLKGHLITMPARYFFVKVITENNSCNLEQEVLLDVQIHGSTQQGRPCRIWTNFLDTKDCLYIARYKVYETCHHLTINVKYEDRHVAQSPYIMKEVLADECTCPIKDLNRWLVNWECGDLPKQITRDLSIFKNIDFIISKKKIIDKFGSNPRAVSLCHYVIKENNIYRKCYGEYVGFKMFVDGILLSLTRKVVLPDLELFVNLGDWPLVKENTDVLPIFSWCGSKESFDVVMPTYDITESTLENMGRVMLDMLSVQGNVKDKWDNRIPKLFWRGRDSSHERLRLIEISRKYPDIINASLTNFFFFRSEEEIYGPKTNHVSFFNFFDYKYQLNLDGTVAAYRLPYLLAGGSLVFKQDSTYYEHFYNELVPYTHYIPVKRDLSDLIEQINWAVQNDNNAKLVARAGQEFALQNLMPKDIYCYYVFLLNEYSKKIVSKVNVEDGMEIVTDKVYCKCNEDIKEEL